MHSTKPTQGASGRRASGPRSVSIRQNSSEKGPTDTVATTTVTKSAALKSTAPVAGATSPLTAVTSSATATLSSITAATSSLSSDQTEIPTTGEFYKTPMVMTPVSRISKGPRRNSRPDVPTGDGPATWDPEHYNPDGSLRKVHTLPGFEQAYAQAGKARYIRHKDQIDREKELSISEIFGKSDQD